MTISTVAADSFKSLDWWKKLASEDDSFLVYGGDRSYDRAGTSVISWRDQLPSDQFVPDGSISSKFGKMNGCIRIQASVIGVSGICCDLKQEFPGWNHLCSKCL